jgi:phosphoribosylamine-glycine ligase
MLARESVCVCVYVCAVSLHWPPLTRLVHTHTHTPINTQACCEGRLDAVSVPVRSGYAVTVVAASAGYPDAYAAGHPITFGAEASGPHRRVYLAGTKQATTTAATLTEATAATLTEATAATLTWTGRVTAGGRVVAATGLGATLQEALAEAYASMAAITFQGMHYRRDIGHRYGHSHPFIHTHRDRERERESVCVCV